MPIFDPVGPQTFSIVPGGRWDTVNAIAPIPTNVESAAKSLGLEYQVRLKADGVLVITAKDLTLDTMLETWQHGDLSVRDAIDLPEIFGGGKLRCQSPFRDSASFAAFLAKNQSGRPFVHDSGTGINHYLNDDGWADICFGNIGGIPDGTIASIRPPAYAALEFDGDVSALFSDVVLREEDVIKMVEAEFLINNMIVRGHVAAYVAPGNGGKTTLFMFFCEKLSAMGIKVLYINVDGSPGDLKRHHEHAVKHKYLVIAPDARDGKSTSDVLEKLHAIADGPYPCDEYVFILDTLKKFVDVIDKRQAKDLYKLMRTLTVKGATICLLGHCNKHKDDDGKLIFEGTADLRNDLDELIYLDSCKNEQKETLEVTTRPDKVRADFKPISFEIDLKNDRKVRELSSVINIIAKDERELIDLIKAAISEGNRSQKDIINWVKGKTIAGEKKIRDRLLKHPQIQNPEFTMRMTGRGKDLEYSLIDPILAFQSEVWEIGGNS